MGNKSVLIDVQTLRAQARQHVEEGAVTAGYTADRNAVLKLLNEALATELVCVLRYRRHYFYGARHAGEGHRGRVFGTCQ